MPSYSVQQTIATADNVPENYATNTWHFNATGTTDLESIMTALQAFYQACASRMSNLVRQTDHPYKIYDLEDTKPRAPIVEDVWSFSSAFTAAALPTEVSLCLSFQGAKVSGTPQARKRGRIYLAFMGVGNLATDGRPTESLQDQVAGAGAGLWTAAASNVWDWVVYSPTAAASGAGFAAFSPVIDGWVDDEWDTQRRRGRGYTRRALFPVPG